MKIRDLNTNKVFTIKKVTLNKNDNIQVLAEDENGKPKLYITNGLTSFGRLVEDCWEVQKYEQE